MSEIQMIRVRDLQRPPYQEARYRKTIAERRAREWKENLAGILVVSYRDNIYWVVDGNHRVGAARIKYGPNHEMRCEVLQGMSPGDEVELFLALEHTSRRITRMEQFQAHLAVGNDAHVNIAKACANQGFNVAPGSSGRAVSAVSALEQIYGFTSNGAHKILPARCNPSPALLSRTLRVSVMTWGQNTEAVEGRWLTGLAMFLGFNADKDVNEKQLAKKVQKYGSVAQVIGRAGAQAGATGGGIAMAIARFLTDVYNSGKRNEELKLEYPE